jgi:hypothetical protein
MSIKRRNNRKSHNRRKRCSFQKCLTLRHSDKTENLNRRLKRLAENPNCEKEYSKIYYASNPQYVIGLTTQWHKKHKKHYNADDEARYYTILKDHCEVCGTTKIYLERMHLDYSKPLEIVTSCRKCHKKFDTIQRQYGFIDVFPEPNTRHCDTCLKHFYDCQRARPSLKGRNCQLWEGNEEPFIETGWYEIDDLTCIEKLGLN